MKKEQKENKKNITVEVNQNAPHQPPVEHNTVPRMRISNLFTEHENYFKRPVVIKTLRIVTGKQQTRCGNRCSFFIFPGIMSRYNQ